MTNESTSHSRLNNPTVILLGIALAILLVLYFNLSSNYSKLRKEVAQYVHEVETQTDKLYGQLDEEVLMMESILEEYGHEEDDRFGLDFVFRLLDGLAHSTENFISDHEFVYDY